MSRSIRWQVDAYFSDIERDLEEVVEQLQDEENYSREDIAQNVRDLIEKFCE
jgi:hypothetical protein